jgi:hypothetical protein
MSVGGYDRWAIWMRFDAVPTNIPAPPSVRDTMNAPSDAGAFNGSGRCTSGLLATLMGVPNSLPIPWYPQRTLPTNWRADMASGNQPAAALGWRDGAKCRQYRIRSLHRVRKVVLNCVRDTAGMTPIDCEILGQGLHLERESVGILSLGRV